MPIVEYPLRQPFSAGIEMKADRGLVPEYEEREACIFSNYNWRDWLTLPWQERAYCVAHYRLHHMIESHVQQAAEQYARRQSAK